MAAIEPGNSPIDHPQVRGFIATLRSSGIDVVFECDERLPCGAEASYGPKPRVKYKQAASPTIDILHELLHVKQFYIDRFGMLSWFTNCPPSSWPNCRRFGKLERSSSSN